jgi:hypothetical protein
MNISSGIRVPVLLVMMASMVVSSGCSDIMGLFLCRSEEFWDYSKFGCQKPDPEKVKEHKRLLDKCDEEGGRWMVDTDTCSFAAKEIKELKEIRRCYEEGGEWIDETSTCSFAARDKEKAKAADSNAAVKPDKQPDKSNAK